APELRDHPRHSRQYSRDSGVGPDVDGRAVVDVAQAQRPQRENSRRPRPTGLRWRHAVTGLGRVTRPGSVTGLGVAGRGLPTVARLRVTGRRRVAERGVPVGTRRRIAHWWIARRWVCGGRVADRRGTPIRGNGG